MSQLLDGIPNVECSIDDILIHAPTTEELNVKTKVVIEKISSAGLKLNKEKCLFNKDSLKFLGHILSSEGLIPDDEKIKVIRGLDTPKDTKQLQRFLGMVTYVSKFIPNCSEITAPLRDLIKKNVSFVWDYAQQRAFEDIKRLLISPPVLNFYDVNLDVKLSVDASQRAMGAVLLQNDHPIAYASKSLTSAQQNYPQIEKEATAIRFACTKFHEYIYGKHLVIETDHKPLETIFKKSIQNAPARLQRILFSVLQYSPNIVYKKGTDIPIADALSRDCLIESDNVEDEELEVQIILPMTLEAHNKLADDIKNDENLKKVVSYTMNGWPTKDNDIPQEIKHFANFREELAVYEGILFKGDKIVLPKSQVFKIVQATHAGHLGILSTMKRTRQLFYWKNLSKDVVEFVENCSICQQTQRNNVKEPISSKPVPEYPWQRVATDIFTYDAQEHLVIVDSYSGYIDFEPLSRSTSAEVVKILKKSFATHGTPEFLESDNGPQFSSGEFKEFSKNWGFDHETSSPYFPRANGLAERAVQTIKSLLRKCAKDKSDVYKALQNLRNVPRDNNLESPNQRLFSRITRTNVPINKVLLKPTSVGQVTENLRKLRQKQKQYADKGSKEAPELNINDRVRIKMSHRDWTSGTVINRANSPRSMVVKTDDNRIFRRNKYHLASTVTHIQPKVEIVPDYHNNSNNLNTSPNANVSSQSRPIQRSNVNNETENLRTEVTTTRSGRIVKPVARLNL